MPRLKLTYREGDIFRLPLDGGHQAVGVVARADGRGGLLAYLYFVAGLPHIEGARPEEAVLIAHVGDLALMGSGDQRVGRGEIRWPVVGHLADFTRAAWPVPCFYRDLTLQVIHYDDNVNETGATPAAPGDERRYHLDGTYGWKAVENVLNQMLRGQQAA